jgi:hypothetical protein
MHDLASRLGGTGTALLVDATTPGTPTKVAEVTAGANLPVIFVEARNYPLSELILLM